MNGNELRHKLALQKWSAIVEECQSSEMSVSNWCKSKNIVTSSYYKWEKAVLEESRKRTPATTQFVEIPSSVCTKEIASMDLSESGIIIASITTDKMKLQIYDSMPADMLQKVLQVMKC